MANPNPEIWGAPDTWLDQNIMRTGNSYPALKAGKAKVASFRNLYNGNTQNKTPYPDPIDKTICPVGQDPAASCFGKVYIIGTASIPSTDVLNPEVIKEFDSPVNWCFTENGPGTQGWTIRDYWTASTDFSNVRWSPNTGTLNTNLNRNVGVCPFVFYQLKTLLLSIKVSLIDGYSDSYYGYMPYNNQQWVTLADWKNNYPNKKAFEIKFEINSVQTADTTNIIYQNYSYNMGNFDTVSVALLDGLELKSNNSTLFYDYATFQIQAKSQEFKIVNAFHNTNDANRRNVLMSIDKFENSVIRATKGTSTDYVYCAWQEIPYTENNYESIMRMVSCFGVPFTDTNKLSFKLDFTDNELCLPVIDENGITHGEYTRGSANTTNDIYNADSVRDKNYEPGKQVDSNTYSSQTYFNQVLNLASMTRRYVLDGAAVEQLGRDLWEISDDLAHVDPADTFKNYEDLLIDNFLTNNPIDCIISLDKYPILNIPTGTQAEPIKYGKVTGAALGKPLNTTSYFFNFEGVRIFPKFGKSFLDYEPYTHYELYVPFCDTIQIDPGDIIDRILSVIMCIDFSTGTVTAYVMADNLCINTLNGSCSINIPVTGTDGVTLNSQINNGIINTKKAQGNLFLGGFLNMFTIGGIGKLALDPTSKANQIMQGSLDKAQAVYDLKHTEVPMHTIGSASPVGSWSLELTCRLMIYYPEGEAIDSSGGVSSTSPKLADLTEYGHTTGFACVMNGKVSDFHGLTVGNIDTSSISGASEEERSMIKSMFSQGVWLP